jgi:hypothetical protein
VFRSLKQRRCETAETAARVGGGRKPKFGRDELVASVKSQPDPTTAESRQRPGIRCSLPTI